MASCPSQAHVGGKPDIMYRVCFMFSMSLKFQKVNVGELSESFKHVVDCVICILMKDCVERSIFSCNARPAGSNMLISIFNINTLTKSQSTLSFAPFPGCFISLDRPSKGQAKVRTEQVLYGFL